MLNLPGFQAFCWLLCWCLVYFKWTFKRFLNLRYSMAQSFGVWNKQCTTSAHRADSCGTFYLVHCNICNTPFYNNYIYCESVVVPILTSVRGTKANSCDNVTLLPTTGWGFHFRNYKANDLERRKVVPPCLLEVDWSIPGLQFSVTQKIGFNISRHIHLICV